MDSQQTNQQRVGRRPGAANKTVIIVLVVLLVVGILACGLCAGLGFFGWSMSQKMLSDQLTNALAGNPAVVEHLGEIQSCTLNLTATGQASQSGGQRLAFDVVGSKGSGTIFASQDPSNPQQQVVPIELHLESGEVIDLAADPAAGVMEVGDPNSVGAEVEP